MFKNALHTQVLTLISLLLIKTISSIFQKMFIKDSSFMFSKYLILTFIPLMSLLHVSDPGPVIMAKMKIGFNFCLIAGILTDVF